jgi:long-chain-fatty-acid--CoA ligase ACSBG
MQNQGIFPKTEDDEYYYISAGGLNKLCEIHDPKEPLKNVLWTTDYKLELPIKMAKSGYAS